MAVSPGSIVSIILALPGNILSARNLVEALLLDSYHADIFPTHLSSLQHSMSIAENNIQRWKDDWKVNLDEGTTYPLLEAYWKKGEMDGRDVIDHHLARLKLNTQLICKKLSQYSRYPAKWERALSTKVLESVKEHLQQVETDITQIEAQAWTWLIKTHNVKNDDLKHRKRKCVQHMVYLTTLSMRFQDKSHILRKLGDAYLDPEPIQTLGPYSQELLLDLTPGTSKEGRLSKLEQYSRKKLIAHHSHFQPFGGENTEHQRVPDQEVLIPSSLPYLFGMAFIITTIAAFSPQSSIPFIVGLLLLLNLAPPETRKFAQDRITKELDAMKIVINQRWSSKRAFGQFEGQMLTNACLFKIVFSPESDHMNVQETYREALPQILDSVETKESYSLALNENQLGVFKFYPIRTQSSVANNGRRRRLPAVKFKMPTQRKIELSFMVVESMFLLRAYGLTKQLCSCRLRRVQVAGDDSYSPEQHVFAFEVASFPNYGCRTAWHSDLDTRLGVSRIGTLLAEVWLGDDAQKLKCLCSLTQIQGGKGDQIDGDIENGISMIGSALQNAGADPACIDAVAAAMRPSSISLDTKRYYASIVGP